MERLESSYVLVNAVFCRYWMSNGCNRGAISHPKVGGSLVVAVCMSVWEKEMRCLVGPEFQTQTRS